MSEMVRIKNVGNGPMEFSLYGLPVVIPPGKSIVLGVDAKPVATRCFNEQAKAGASKGAELEFETFTMPSAEALFTENEALKAEVAKLKSAAKAAKAKPDPSAMPPSGLSS